MSQYNSSYTGQQIDTAVGKALNPDTTPTASSSALVTSGGVKSAIINQNIIDNPTFLINQRGITTGIASGAYGPDRWIVYNSQSENVTIQNGAVLPVNGSVLQRLDAVTIAALTGRTVTASALIEQNGSLSLISGTVASFSSSGASQYFTSQNLSILLTDSYTRSIQFFANSACTLKAVKLELGDTQTLAHQENGVWVLNEIPNYEEQLIRCKSSTADSSDTYANDPVAFKSALDRLRLQYYSATVDLSDLTWTARTGCWTASKTLSSLFGATDVAVITVNGYGGIPVYVFIDGNNAVFTQWASGTPTGTITVRGWRTPIEAY